MANITLDARQQQKHDTSTNFNNANKLYLEGEFLVETDTGKVKIGDGTLGYKSLPYTIGTRVPEGAKFTDTTYTAGTGLSLNGTSFSISNSGVTAGSYGPSQDSSVGFGDSIDVPYISVNSRGQITSADSRSITLPAEPTPASIGAANKIHTHPTRDVFKNATDNWAGSVSAIDVPKINSIRSPKSAFLPANCITVEYSSNGGSTWSDYGLTDVQKQDLFALSTSSNIKLSKSSPVSTNDCVRITIEPLDRYVSFDQLYVWFSTGSHTCALDLERSTIGAKDTFSFIRKDVPLGGWSGPNVINFPYGTFGGGTSQTNNAYKYRITFKTIKLGSSTQSPTISDIRFYGENAWIIPNDMVKNDYPFSWDRDMNVNFPKQLKEQGKRVYSENNKPTPDAIGAEPAFTKNTAFNKNFGTTAGTVCQGNDSRLSNARPASDVSAWAKEPNKPTYTPTEVGVIGTAPTSGQVAVFDGTTGKIKSTGFTIASSVPSGAKFTDTTYSAATSTVLGLVKVGYTESGKNYPVELDADDKMFVNVPWTDTTYSVATVSEDGLMPKIPSSSAQYLNGMGQWSTPPDTKYTNFVGSGSEAKSGLVPSPGTTAGTTKYLREDGTWSVPPDTTYIAGRAIEISQGAISVTSSGVSSGAYGLTDSTSVNIGTSFTVPGFVVDQCGRLTQAYSRTVTVNAPNMTGATTSAAGTAGLVPTPTAGKPTRYLCSTGEWSIPTGTIYNGSTTISVKPSTTDGEYNIYLAALFPGTTSQSVGPSASGTINFGSAFNVPYITIDQYGRITALANRSMILSGALASSSAPGLCPKLDSGHPSYYLNANGTWSLPRGRVYGVKGEAETDYREGQVNITAANVGALALTGGTVSGSTTFSNNVTINGELNYDGGFY